MHLPRDFANKIAMRFDQLVNICLLVGVMIFTACSFLCPIKKLYTIMAAVGCSHHLQRQRFIGLCSCDLGG